MSERDYVTILIPTYRRPQRLERALKSAVQQGYHELRIRVFDNASGDETEAVVRSVAAGDARVEYIRHAQNLGMIGNFRAAMDSVDTPYFAFLCDDDALLPNAIDLMMTSLREHPEVAFWAGHCLRVDESSGREIGGSRRHWLRSGVYDSMSACTRMCRGAHLDLQGIVFRTSCIRESFVGFHDQILINDVDLELQMASRYPIGVTAEPVALMYAGSDSISGGVQAIESFWPALRLIEKRLVRYGGLSGRSLQRCRKLWRTQSIMILWYLGGKAALAGVGDAVGRYAAVLSRQHFIEPLARLAHAVLTASNGSRLQAKVGFTLWMMAKALHDPRLFIGRLLARWNRVELGRVNSQ